MEDTRRGMTLSLRDLVPDVAHFPSSHSIGYRKAEKCGHKRSWILTGLLLWHKKRMISEGTANSLWHIFFHQTFYYINFLKFQNTCDTKYFDNKSSDTKICKERFLWPPRPPHTWNSYEQLDVHSFTPFLGVINKYAKLSVSLPTFNFLKWDHSIHNTFYNLLVSNA